MTSPTNQIKRLARFIADYWATHEGADFPLFDMAACSPILLKELTHAMDEIGDVRKVRDHKAAEPQRKREEARWILLDLPESTSAHARQQFAKKVLALSTEDLVRRRNAQNLLRYEDIPERDLLEVACQVVSAEMVRRRRNDFVATTTVEDQVSFGNA
ncbi:hypothetical protein U879_01880 [Defluviimonas sp. 20V17]|uniref:Uncharacterized protein n=1 Tax=Allgaiera indica TaxID=765699 RepID=A0AAN5A0H2_9RHOB|nr:hypothetical protein [Allgaiera indica]KDB05387.1 hypothetical protein U879_01880 [Defluviimonas sp. 20V17]GHE04188.1 hypothetical protein GCM10008024_30410 [Allgaiera indica]